MQETDLDIIETNNRLYCGIIDYVSSKYVIFYDVSKNPSAQKLMEIYKSRFPNMRFAVFLETFFTQHNLHPILFNKKSIVSSSKPLEINLPNRKIYRNKVTSTEYRDGISCESNT
jgi:hypothetical protein